MEFSEYGWKSYLCFKDEFRGNSHEIIFFFLMLYLCDYMMSMLVCRSTFRGDVTSTFQVGSRKPFPSLWWCDVAGGITQALYPIRQLDVKVQGVWEYYAWEAIESGRLTYMAI